MINRRFHKDYILHLHHQCQCYLNMFQTNKHTNSNAQRFFPNFCMLNTFMAYERNNMRNTNAALTKRISMWIQWPVGYYWDQSPRHQHGRPLIINGRWKFAIEFLSMNGTTKHVASRWLVKILVRILVERDSEPNLKLGYECKNKKSELERARVLRRGFPTSWAPSVHSMEKIFCGKMVGPMIMGHSAPGRGHDAETGEWSNSQFSSTFSFHPGVLIWICLAETNQLPAHRLISQEPA